MSKTILLGLLSSSACAYQPGSFDSLIESFPGSRVTIGCLDVSVELARDPAADGLVLGYTVGNRCDRVTTVDLAAVAVSSATSSGVPLRPYDPDRELRPLTIEARSVAREQIEYVIPRGAAMTHAVCVDIGQINGPGDARWLCFEGEPRPGETELARGGAT